MISDKELIEMAEKPNLFDEEYLCKAIQYHVQTHPLVDTDENTFKNVDKEVNYV